MPGVHLDQLRARRAYAWAASRSAEALAMARELPTMLQRNGLLATWAYLLAKKETALLGALLEHLRDGRLAHDPVQGDDPATVFRRWVGSEGEDTRLDASGLRRLTAEVTALSVWLKRAAEAHEEGGTD